MRTQIEFLITPSKAPQWLLRYVQELKFCYSSANMFPVTIFEELENARAMLKDVDIVQRALVRCAYDIVGTEISGNALIVKSSLGKPLLKVSMEEWPTCILVVKKSLK